MVYCPMRTGLALAFAASSIVGSSAPARAAMPVAECVRRALEHSPAARAAAFQVDAATADRRAARSAYRPRLFAEAEYGRSEGFDEAVTNGGSTAALLTVEATLLDGGLRDAEFAAARARLRGAEARAQQERADLALAVRTAYFTGLAARTQIDIQKDALRILHGR